MNIFISGGCKNGKSIFAQELAAKQSREQNIPLYYLATMIPVDEEDRARIERHLKERNGWGFTTLEQGREICKVLEREDVSLQGSFLLDSVTALLSNEMFRSDGTLDQAAPQRLGQELAAFAVQTGNTVFVSDFIYADALKYDPWTECYRKGLAEIDRILARVCDRVIEAVYGNCLDYKAYPGAGSF